MSLSAKRVVTTVAIAVAMLFVSVESPAQSVLDRIRKAAEEAAKGRGAPPPAPVPGTPAPAPQGRGATPNAAPANVPASSAKVEELSLASGQQLKFVVAPKGGHAAAVVLRGSRTVVVHDGVDGPRFDAILGDSGGLMYSPDGSRLAYAGRQGMEYVYMADGKELLRVPVASHPQMTNAELAAPHFTDNSKHVYFQLYTEAPGGSTGSGAYRLFVDGVPGPESFSPVTPIFAAAGDHHTYMVESRQKRGTYSLVIDGKPSPIAGGEPQLTADGLHVFTKRQIPGPTPTTEVLLDGKPIMRAQSAQIHTTPIGAGFMTVVTQGTPGSGIHFLTMGTQRIPGTDCPWSPGYTNVEFSPDAKHWAAVCQASASSYSVVVDGKKGQEYQTIQPAGFTADGRFVYGAGMRSQSFMVIGDQESDAFGSIQSASDPMTAAYEKRLFNLASVGSPAALVGNHIAYTAQPVNQGTMFSVVVDGKPLQREVATRVIFSPDGSHFGFTFGRTQYKNLNIDGKDMPGSVVPFQTPGNGRNRPRSEFTFSPDGRRFAYFDMQPDNQSGLYVDGRRVLVFPGTQPENPTFTPDGRHLLWLANVFGGGHVIFVDGRPALRTDGNFQMQISAGAWEMGADGTLTVVAQAGDAIKRFRITPGSDTSVDTIGK